MNLYRISNGVWTGDKLEASIEDAEAYAASLGVGYTATLLQENYKEFAGITGPTRREYDTAFGRSIFNQFVDIQRAAHLDVGQAMTLAQTRLVENKFGELRRLVLAGDIIQARAALDEMTVDLLLPIELKTLFLAKIDEYLAKF